MSAATGFLERAQPQLPACADCLGRGHYCPGAVTCDGGATHLCFACDEGRPCGAEKAQRMEIPAASPVDLVIEQHEERTAKASLRAARLLGRRRKEPTTVTISASTRAQIEQALREHPGTELAIARRFGVGYSTVQRFHKEMRAAGRDTPSSFWPPREKPKIDFDFDIAKADPPPPIDLPPVIAEPIEAEKDAEIESLLTGTPDLPTAAKPDLPHVTFHPVIEATLPGVLLDSYARVIADFEKRRRDLGAMIAALDNALEYLQFFRTELLTRPGQPNPGAQPE